MILDFMQKLFNTNSKSMSSNVISHIHETCSNRWSEIGSDYASIVFELLMVGDNVYDFEPSSLIIERDNNILIL